jgi:hypothetical protein
MDTLIKTHFKDFKITAFLDVGAVQSRRNYRLLEVLTASIITAVSVLEASVNFYETSRCSVPRDSYLAAVRT